MGFITNLRLQPLCKDTISSLFINKIYKTSSDPSKILNSTNNKSFIRWINKANMDKCLEISNSFIKIKLFSSKYHRIQFLHLLIQHPHLDSHIHINFNNNKDCRLSKSLSKFRYNRLKSRKLRAILTLTHRFHLSSIISHNSITRCQIKMMIGI